MTTTEVARRIPKDLAGNPWTGPAKYHLFVEVPKTPAPGEPKSVDMYVGRVGTTNDLSKIPGMIADDLLAMNDTFGGLIDPLPTSAKKGRFYRVFEMAPKELDCAEILRTYSHVDGKKRKPGRRATRG